MGFFTIQYAGCYLAYLDPDTSLESYLEVQSSAISAASATITDNGNGTLSVSGNIIRSAGCLMGSGSFTGWRKCAIGISISPSNSTEVVQLPSSTANPVDALAWLGDFHQNAITTGVYDRWVAGSVNGYSQQGSSLKDFITITNQQVTFPNANGVSFPAGNLNILNTSNTQWLNFSTYDGVEADAGFWQIRFNLTISGTLSPVFTLDHIEFTDSQTAIVFYTHNGNAGKALYKKGGGVWWPIDNALFGIMKLGQNYNYIRANNSIYNVRMLSQDLGVFDARS